MPRTLLLVEDNEDDVFFVTRAFKAAGLIGPLVRVHDGQRAIDYLSGTGDYKNRISFPIPSVMLLDVKMPFMSGFEVLRWIRQESPFRSLPVLIFTSSNEQCDVERAYALGANAYLVKPPRTDDYPELAGLIKRFWLDANLPPPVEVDEMPAGPAAHPLQQIIKFSS